MKYTILFFSIMVYCTACSDSNNSTKEPSEEKSTVAVEKTNTDNVISFKVNDELITTKPLGITWRMLGDMQLINIITDREKSPKTINITVNSLKSGVHQFADSYEAMNKVGKSFGSYTPDAKNDALNVYSFVEGSFDLVSVDTVANVINATFSGTVKNVKGEVIKITEGKISQARISKGQ